MANPYEKALIALLPKNATGGESAGFRESLEERTSLSLRLFLEAVEQSPVAISITDERANIIYVNRAFTQITGYSREEAIGNNESMLSHKTTPRQVYEEMWGRLNRKESWNGVLVNRHKTKGPYLADLTIAPMLNSQGEISHFIGIHRDVTGLYGLEQKVKNQKRLIETVVDSIPVAAVLLDENDEVVFDNQVYKGLTSELGVSEPVEIFLDILKKEMDPGWAELRDRQKSFRNRELRVDLSGNRAPRWFSCAGTWFTERDIGVEAYFQQREQTYLLLTLTDITQQKRQQEEIRTSALKALMAEEERIQGLRETLCGVIHQIQAPVNLLSAAVNTLERRGKEDNEAVLQLLKQVLESGRETVLMLQRCMPEPEAVAMASVNLNQILHEVLMLLTPRLLANGVVVDWQPTPVLPTIMAMENRLRAMFKQLIENAIDAMSRTHRQGSRFGRGAPAGGEPGTAGIQGRKPRELRLATRVEADSILVTIEDTGPGIPKELHTKVFEPFFTTKGASGRQAGMGLAMVQDVVNQHAGMILIDPDYSEGCRFRLKFDRSGPGA
ncbi:MAG TPA: nitrogen fixation negative regulator NifL [Methylococcus sp.]|nr:nitrogen fixation negative regulator NifL [Methylococcus sp.]